MDPRIGAYISYYAREGWMHRLQSVCNEVLRRSSQPVLQFWRSYGLLAGGQHAEALRELQAIQYNADAELAAAAAMLVIHESSRVVDQEAVVSLSAKLEVEERTAGGAAALHLANFYAYRHSFERARGLLERALRMPAEPGLQQRLAAALGWCILQQQQHQQEVEGEHMDAGELAAAVGHFRAALQLDGGDLEALLGHARALELQNHIDQAAEVLSEAAVRFSWFVPGLLEHLRLLLAQKEWEGVVEGANLVLHAEPDNASALSMLALVELVKEGDSRQAADLLGRAAAALVKQEPSGAALCFNMARAFGRLAGSEPALLSSTIMLAERAVALQPGNADYLVELASQRLAQGDATKAGDLYAQALGADELHLPASLGVVESLLVRGDLEDAAVHLQLLPELVAAAKLATAPVGASAISRAPSTGVLVAGAGDSLDEGTLDSAASAAEQHLLYLQGLLAWQQGEASTGLQQLQRSCQMLLAAAEGVPLGLQTFVVLQPGRIMAVVQALLGSLGGEPRGANDAPAPLLGSCMRVLEMMGRYTGALPAAQLLYARALYLNASYDAATRKAGDLLRTNPSLVAGHLLVAKAALQQGRPEDAAVALEAALSADFTVKDSPLYALVNAQVAVAEQRFDQARKVLEAALSLPGVKGKLSAEQKGRLLARGALPSTTERASIYLLLVEVLRRSGTQADQTEARKVMGEALSLFTGSSEEARVTVADCDLAVAAGDVEGALQRLARVAPTSPHYPRSRVALADIHLKQRKDKAAYIQCYLDLLEQRPGFDSHCLLGEALLAIQEPEKAVVAFEAALEFYPKDASLAVKCADALVAAHDYHRAVDYYNRAIRNDPTQLELQHRLAQLLIRLGQAAAAAALLGRCLERARAGAGSTESLAMDVDTWLLLSRLQEQQAHHEEALASHAKAVEIQELLLARLAAQGTSTGLGSTGALPTSSGGGRESMAGASSGGAVGGRGGGGLGAGAQRQRAAGLCFDLAEQHRKARAFDKASEMYEAALKQVPGHVPSLLALARLALAGGDLEGCRERCIALLGAAPDHEEAAMMVAEIMAYQEQYDAAVATFHALLSRQPCHYGALVRLLGLLRRAGRLASDAPRYIAAAEAAAGGRPESQAGLRYCQGLQQWWLNKPRDALKHFAAARKDPRWASEALLHMVEVALAPDAVLDENWAAADDVNNNAAGGSDAASAGGGKKGGKSTKEGRAEARAVAQGLLHQLRPDEVDPSKYKVLSAYVQMSSKARGDVEAALSSLLDLAATEPNNVPVLLALSHGFLLLKQAPKARNQLKRVAKIPYQPEAGEEFERAWLALADLHIQGGKFDLAQELCQRCLKYNKSCAHAWELLGSIAEREAAYADAAAHYEQAWRLASQSSCVLGYKLSFNYLKAARCVDAVSVAQAVLKLDANYPAIEKEVLQKAWAGLRP